MFNRSFEIPFLETSRLRRWLLFPLVAAAFLACSTAQATPVNSSISANFNGTAIPGGQYIWFNSVLSTTGTVPSGPFTVDITNATISFTANSKQYTLAVPDAAVTFNSTTGPSTSFANNTWTTLDTTHNNNAFLSGLAFQVPSGGLPGGIQNVTWSANFAASVTGLNLNWKWAAAVYTTLPSNYNSFGVVPVDGSDHAGTPANEKGNLGNGGATGGSGSNYTGSYSGTTSVQPPLQTAPEPSSLLLMLGFGCGLVPALGFGRKKRLPEA
jgi:hypothetical protein